MLPQSELTAYQAVINLPLLNDIIAFVRDTSKGDGALRAALRQNCIFLDAEAKGTAFQEKYGFLYLGELLERYEERFGMSIQDFRAIALALGYTRDMADDSMFIGPQRRSFLRQLKERADGDVYLTGAMYLLSETPNASAPYEKVLYEANHAATEEALFALSLLQDQEPSFSRFKPLLLRLLGGGRTMPALGNMKLLDWFVAWLTPRIKADRGKDLGLFRALAALPVSFVRPGSKHYTTLLDCGWTSLEIAYANMMTVLSQSVGDAVLLGSLLAEKIAVQLFQEVLAHEDALPASVYEQLSAVLRRFAKFSIRYNGHGTLMGALEDGPRIQNPDTFLWFMGHAVPIHSAFKNFDILDSKWDAIAHATERKKYLGLFENSLTDDMDAAAIQSRIQRYDALTEGSYLTAYWEGGSVNRFGLLVNKGILDLWQCFQGSLDAEGFSIKSCMINRVWQYARGLSTIQAYQFYERFFDAYPVLYLERYFGYNYRDFFADLTDSRSYYNSNCHEIELKIQREFLDDGQKRKLLEWLEAYIFAFAPDKYPPFMAAILRDEAVAGLFPMKEQRVLFDTVIRQPNLSSSTAAELKRRYLSEEELQAEREAQATAEQEAQRQREIARIQKIREHLDEKFNGTFASVADYLGDYRYRSDETKIACGIVRERLDEALKGNGYRLDGKDAAQFLHVCAKLAKTGAMTFPEAQTYISAVKERVEDAE